MKIIIGASNQGPFPNPSLYPDQIRALVLDILKSEKAGKPETSFWTLNRTVLDMVHAAESELNEGLSYEDVSVLTSSDLVPLLSLESEDYLCHFALGDLFERNSEIWRR